MTRPTVAQLAARLDTLEREMAALRRLRARDGLTVEEIQASYEAGRRAELTEVHGWLAANLPTRPGRPLTVSAREVMEVLAKHDRFPSVATVEQYLTQLSGLGLAIYLGTRTEGRRTVRQWGILPPVPRSGRPSPRPERM